MKKRFREVLLAIIFLSGRGQMLAQNIASIDSLRMLMHAERYDEVIARGDRMLTTLPASDMSARAEVSFSMASAHYYSQNEKEATRHGQEALRLASAATDTALMLRSTRLLAELLFAGNRYDDAIQMEREGIRLAMAKGDAAHLAKFLSGVGDNYLMTGVPDSAEHYYRRTLSELPMDAFGQRSTIEGNLAKLLSERGDHAQAIAILEPSVERIKQGDPPKYFKALNTLAYVYHRAGRHRAAIDLFMESERLNQEGEKDISTSLENLGFMAESQAALGDHAAAYATMLELEELLHEYYARTANEEILALEKRFETERKEQENALLRAENAARRLNEERLRIRWIAASVAAVLLIGLLAMLYRNYRLRGKHTREVERFNAELKSQRDQVQHMNDLLELKILRAQLNPHFINNCQNSAVAMVKEGRNAEALAYLQGLSKLMRMVLEHSVNDRISVEEEMEFLRLYVKLESLRLSGLIFDVEADERLIEDEAELPALLVQPFVENALWHGLAGKEGPRSLNIRFMATDAGLRCVVRDNGIGRNSHGSRPDGQRSLGTELTNERLQLLTHRLQQKGSFSINDITDGAGNPAGTEVVIELEE